MKSPNKPFRPALFVIVLLFVLCGLYIVHRSYAVNTVSATVDLSTQVGTSQFSPGLTNADTSLYYNWGSNNNAAIDNVTKNLIPNAMPFYNTQIMAWGASDPWPDPAQSGPSNWTTLDDKMQDFLNAKAVNPNEQAVVTYIDAPWWMKGQLQADGTAMLIPDVQGDFSPHTYTQAFTDFRGISYPAGYVSPDPHKSRVLDNQMNNWLNLVDAVARRYMAAPYNVRYFQVWNELKGYYNPGTNAYDYTTNCGNTSAYQATEGYTCMYNQVYNRIMQVAASLGIPSSSVYVGGPYPVMDTWASSSAGGHPTTEPALQNKSYGTYDQRGVDVVKYWLQHKAGAGFITVDGHDHNKDGVNLTDPFTASQKFGDVTSWIRSLDNSVYPGAATLPIWWAEWYAEPYTNITDDYNNAVKAYAIAKLLEAGGAVPLEWGGVGNGTNATGLWTDTAAGGGQPLPWYGSYQDFYKYFPPGTKIYKTTVSDSSQLEVLASSGKSMLINKTNSTIVVSLNGAQISLNPYQVTMVATPASSPSPTPSCAPIPGDINSDCKVDAIDLSILLSHWGTSFAGSDLNHDGTTNLFDLSILLSHWTG